MRDLNQRFLQALTEKMRDYKISTHIGDVILSFCPYFKVYGKQMSNRTSQRHYFQMYKQYAESSESREVKKLLRRLEAKSVWDPKRDRKKINVFAACQRFQIILREDIKRF